MIILSLKEIKNIVKKQKNHLVKTREICANSSQIFSKSLKKLDNSELAAVVGVSLISQMVLLSEISGGLDKKSITVIQKQLNSISPKLNLGDMVIGPKAVFKIGGCFDASIAYAMAVQRCEDDGRREEECLESIGPAAELAACQLKQLEGLQGIINMIWKRLKLPRPIPFPIR
ncbi:hypothetical protein [Nitrosopumilus sp. b2]|uniref:hypothetical protein n=1 Tax=Nitrosopumilus sp. b2 TaxID=2109908 RepID=UPI001C70BAF7|nr:hypothetical protein [Nitrosopumilus sp. b2]